jgi:DNA-binding NarL/FixJ family response regulator
VEQTVESAGSEQAATTPVRLLLVDDHQVVLEGLVSMLASERHRVTVLGATTEPAEALRLCASLEPDIVLLDVRLKGASGLDLCQELTRRLERVMSGEVTIDPALAGRVAVTAARLQSGEFWPGSHLGLTQRESEVLQLMVRGLSNRAIGQQLYIGEETVKTHSRSIYRKLDVGDRSQAVAVALREGIFH